jgi:hypothetical protein
LIAAAIVWRDGCRSRQPMPLDTIGLRDCHYVKSERDYWVKVARPAWTKRTESRARTGLSPILSHKMAAALINRLPGMPSELLRQQIFATR